MSKEAMKLALAWAKASGEIVFAGGGMAAVEAMNTWVASAEKALAEQPAQPQEPFGYFRYDLRLDAWVQNRAGLTGTPFYTSPPAQQEPVERGGLRFYTNGTERQHWKADGSIDFKDKQGNVTMTIAAGSITSSPASKPLTDEEIWKFWWSRPEVPDGEDDSMEAEFVAAVRRVLAALGIKENT